MADMNVLALFAAAAPEEGVVESILTRFGWHPQLFLSQLIVFVLVAFLLNKFAYKPILAILEERKQRIAESLQNAEKIQTELAKTEEARKEILTQANTQANQLIQEARDLAAKVRDAESQKAIATAEEIIRKAREASQADHARMLAELKREVGRLVVQTTAAVVGKILTDADQKRLVEETEKELAA